MRIGKKATSKGLWKRSQLAQSTAKQPALPHVGNVLICKSLRASGDLEQLHDQKTDSTAQIAADCPHELFNSQNSPTENMTDPVRKSSNQKASLRMIANLKLQIGQLILGASQRSAQESAGSHCRFRFNFISRYQSGRQGYPANENGFNVFVTY